MDTKQKHFSLDTSRHKQTSMRVPTFVACMIVTLGMVVSAILTYHNFKNSSALDQVRFVKLCDQIENDVTNRIRMKEYGMAGTRSAFAASNYVDHDEFARLVAARDLPREFPGAMAIAYIELIPDDPAAETAYVQTLRDQGMSGFTVHLPQGAGPLAGSVIDGKMILKYAEPGPQHKAALGLDVGAHPVRRAAAERAALTGLPQLSGMIRFAGQYADEPGFLYLMPEYLPGMPTQTQAQRLAALRGWVCMPILAAEAFEGVKSVTNDELDIKVYCSPEMSPASRVYDTAPTPPTAPNHTAEAEPNPLEIIKTIPMGGQMWALHIQATDDFEKTSTTHAWTIAGCGSSLSLLLGLMVYTQGSSTRRAQALAKGMTADLREYAHQAQQATRSKSAFLANMSHEIRTPMTAILGYTDLLREQINPDNHALVGHTDTIKRNGEHLLSLINDILDISKIEAGKLEMERLPVRPDKVVSEVLALMHVKADEKNLTLGAEMLTDLPAAFPCDPVRLRQVLMNLVGNAIKFTDTGGVRIHVSYDSTLRQIRFDVIDTGIGMTPQQASRLFGAFEQADVSTTRQFGGSGLGLHISQRLAQMLGGKIRCNTTYGEGSSFILTLDTGHLERPEMLCAGEIRAVHTTVKTPAKPEAPNAPVEAGSPPLHGLCILFAEDGKDNQRLINHHLTKAGARVTLVENGRDAVQALTADRTLAGPLADPPPFDLVLTDIQMPEMDGYTEVAMLREKGCVLPIIALTAHAMTEDIDKCLEAGCDHYASKPIDPKALIATCVNAIAAKASPA